MAERDRRRRPDHVLTLTGDDRDWLTTNVRAENQRVVERAPSVDKGDSLHALCRDLFFADQGHVRRRTPRPGGPGGMPHADQQCRGAVDHHLPGRCARRATRRGLPRQRRGRGEPDPRAARPHQLLRHGLFRRRNRTPPRTTPPTPLTGRLTITAGMGIRDQIRSRCGGTLAGLRVRSGRTLTAPP